MKRSQETEGERKTEKSEDIKLQENGEDKEEESKTDPVTLRVMTGLFSKWLPGKFNFWLYSFNNYILCWIMV